MPCIRQGTKFVSKKILGACATALFIVSLVTLYRGWKGAAAVRPADSYEDRGVHTFAPYRVLPVQVENTSGSRRYRRMHPTRTVYMVQYRTTNESGYRWRKEAPSRSLGLDIVAKKAPEKRRVLAIRGQKKYISIEAEQTAESYTAGLKRKYRWMAGLSAIYGAGFLIAACMIFLRRRESKEWSALHFDNAPSVKKKLR